MPRAERNDPCPCGSGKKYKKCHLDADLTTGREQTAALRQPAPTEHEKRWDALFDQLETASVDEKLRLGRAYIETEPEFDEEDAFALVVELLEPAVEKAGRASVLRPIIELIRERHPAAYEANVGFFATRALDEAYEAGTDPEPHLLEWARTPTRQFDYFERAVGQALFHGRESLAVQVLETGKQALLDDEDLFDDAEADLARAVVEALLAGPRGGAVSPTAIALSEAFEVFRPEHLRERLEHARRSAPLRLDELDVTAGPESLARQLYLLAADFARWLVHQQGWPAGRAALAHLGLEQLLTERVDARLADPEQDELDENDSRPSHRWRGAPPELGALLGFDENTLTRPLSARLGTFGTGAYRVAAVLLALPHWRPYLLEVGGDGSQLSDPTRWLESGAGRQEAARLAKRVDGLAGRVLARRTDAA